MENPNAESSLTLLQRAQAGDRQALDALIQRYRPRLVRWATGRLPACARDLTETQDLVQETLLSAFKKIGGIEIRGEGALQAYLRQVLLNRIRTEIRRIRRKPAGDALSTGIEAADATPLELAVGAEMLDAYDRGLDQLASTDRELVVAYAEYGYSNQELADAFDKPTADAARMALHRALRKLATAMRRA